jgi:Uma2 family endonuclease
VYARIDEERVCTMATIATPVTTRHRLTVADFHRIAEAGIFQEDDRVELIDGEIIDMAPIGSGHAGTVMALNRLLARALGDRAIVLVQSPVVLPEHSEPEPDLALLRPRQDFYRSGHPLPGDILLIIEVADTRLAYDRDVKIPLYARHGIPEVWLVDLEDRRLHVYTSPSASGYLECRILAAPGMLAPAELPGCPVDLSGLFP